MDDMRKITRHASQWFDYAMVGLFLILMAAPATVYGQSVCPVPASVVQNMAEPLATVRYLADDALEGRLAGSPGERCAGDYIAGVFGRLGLEPAGTDGFFQMLPLASSLNPHAPAGDGRNVIAVLRGSDPVMRREIVVIGAHYDHLGHGGFNSLAPDQEGAIHNGADDNASGVSAMLEVARRITSGPRPARSVLFIAFTGEESGLLGSSYFAGNPTILPDTMVAMINLDMVGRLGDGALIVSGVDTAEQWRSLLEPAAAAVDVTLAMQGEGYGPSDHTSFYMRDIPVLHFFTNVHGDYHRPSDDWDRIDGAGIERVATIVTTVAEGVANRRTLLTLVRGAGEPPAPAGEASTSRGYGAWLGSVPDFTPVDRGVRLSGVGPGSPAEAAGLRAGDIIVGMSGREIPDLQALTDILREHVPGDEVEVRFIRDGASSTVKVTLGNRAAR